MNCWRVLELEPGADRAEIKRAYAKKLKITKPDVDPEGFKQLHSAYKAALTGAAVHTSSPKPVTTDVSAPADATSTANTFSEDWDTDVEPSATAWPSEPEANDQLRVDSEALRHALALDDELARAADADLHLPPAENLDQLEQQLLEHIEQALSNRPSATDPTNWTFLEQYEELEDIQLRAEFSFYLFGRLLDQPELVDTAGEAFAYLSHFFGWTDAIDVLADAYGYEAVEDWLLPLQARQAPKRSRWICPKVHPGPLEWGGYYTRLGATLIDLGIIVALVISYLTLASLFTDHDGPDTALVVLTSIPIYLLCAPLFEASPLQGTPGKVLLGLKVTTPSGKRANIFLALWRVLVFAASTAAFKITIWINFLINDGRMLHDRLSGTRVVKRF